MSHAATAPSTKMNRLALLSLLAAALTVGTEAKAQTRAEVIKNRGCFEQAPDGLLNPQLSNVWTVDADGVGVIEIESVDRVAGWVEETTYAGFTGDGYYKWVGGNLFSRPGTGILTYRFFVENPATYQVRLHNRHNHPDPSLENDCWMRVNGSNWIKTYSNNNRNSNQWNWHFRFDPGHTAVQYQFNRGVNEIQISGRSNGFMIDRLVIYPTGQNGQDTTIPESQRLRDRPVLGETVNLIAHDWLSAFGLTAGSTVFSIAAMPGGGPACGQILPGWGSFTSSNDGEWLLDQSRTVSFAQTMPWNGDRLVIPLQIPNNAALLGGSMSLQGAFVKPNDEPMLTPRLELVFGDY